MKITFLGTSHGVPAEDRFCSSALVEVGDRAYLIDGGAPVADLLLRRGVPFSAVRAFFNTHVHSDHLGGAFGFFSLCNWYYKDSDLAVFLPDAGAMGAVKNVLTAMDGKWDDARIRFRTFTAGVIYDDGTLRVTAYPTEHIAPHPAFGFLLEAEGGRVYFTGDLTADLHDVPAFLAEEETDLIVIEYAHCYDHAHFCGVIGKFRAKTVAVNHINRTEVKIPALLASKDAGTFPFRLLVPGDGETFEL